MVPGLNFPSALPTMDLMAAQQDQPSYHSPLLQIPGAVNGSGVDAGTAWHYGDPIGEQRAAESGAVLIDRSHRSVLTVTGADRLTWLHTLTSQFLNSLTDGQATQALVLSPQGHVEQHFFVTEIGETVYLDTEPGAGAGLLRYLDGMRFWSKVEVADVTEAFAEVCPARPAGLADRRVGARSSLIRVLGARHTPGRWLRQAHRDRHRSAFAPCRTVTGGDRPDDRRGAVPAGSWAADALRIPTRRPRLRCRHR